jgi:uncharacterized OB-fold protein
MSESAKRRPRTDDPLTAPHWSATRERRLVVQECEACGYLRWPPGPICPQCQHPHARWTQIRPTGVLWSSAEYHRALDEAFADDVPYTVGLVELDDGPRMYGTMIGNPGLTDIGRPVRAVFVDVDDDLTLVHWEVVAP